MYKLCVSEQSAQRQRELEAGLLSLMQTRRYEDISVSDLCDHLQIPRKSFYRYFSGKDGALHALLDHTPMEYPQTTMPDTPAGIQHSVEEYFRFWKGQKPLLDALHRSDLTTLLLHRAILLTVVNGSIAIWRTPEDDTITHEHMVIFTLSGLLSLVIQWHQNGFRESIPRMAASASRLLTKPLFSTTAPPAGNK